MADLFGTPTLARSGDGRLELFAFDQTGRLWHLWQRTWSGGWSRWELRGELGEPVEPATVHPSGDGRLEMFVASPAGLQHQWQTLWGNGWSGTVSLGAPPEPSLGFFGPGLAADADGRLTAWVASGRLWHIHQEGWSSSDVWSDWQPHGLPPSGRFVIGPVTAERSADGRIYAFVIDLDGSLWCVM